MEYNHKQFTSLTVYRQKGYDKYMSKTKELNPTAGAERPGKREKLKRRARKLGALALSVAAAVGLYHEAHKPAMDGEQMREATSIAAEVISDKISEFEGEDPRYTSRDGSYSSYRDSQDNSVDFFTYNITEPISNPVTGETEDSGTYVAINVENNVNGSVYDKGKKGKISETEFTFKSDNPQDFNNLVADGQLTRDEVDEFINRDDVSVSEISSLYDANKDGKLTPETLKYNSLTGGDENWRLEIDEYYGVSGVDKGKDGLSGEDAVAQVQRVVDMVKIDNWGESK